MTKKNTITFGMSVSQVTFGQRAEFIRDVEEREREPVNILFMPQFHDTGFGYHDPVGLIR